MISFLDKFKIRLHKWITQHVNGPHARKWLAGFSFSEATFFPIPADVPLIAILFGSKNVQWKKDCLTVTLFSVLGGIFGYLIGYFLFDTIGRWLIDVYDMETSFALAGEMFRDNAFWAVFISGFTPIPYKIFTISAGFFNISLLIFIFASLLSRALRFFAVGYIMKVFGKEIGGFVFKYFNILTIVATILLLLVLIFIKLPF